jgi:3-isopropylmalate/(R)-2-methylmalate dehydratase small subunit
MPRPFTSVTSIPAPLIRDNVDTDVIIRVERLFGAVPREELGLFAFEALRCRADGTRDPDFPLNNEVYQGAEILLTGDNFGCGSAREGAVWALAGMGYRTILAPSFADMFTINCFQNGILPVMLHRDRVQQLAAFVISRPAAAFVTVDLNNQTVTGPDGLTHTFDLPALRRQALLEGLDDIAMSMKHSDDIHAFRIEDRRLRPWAYPIDVRK